MASSKELADKLGTDTKTLRKFLRSHLAKDSLPGQGGRYEFTPGEVKRLEKAWTKWAANKVDRDEPKDAGAKTKATTRKSRAKKDEAVEEVDDIVEDEADEADVEPTDDELAELDDLVDDEE